jgi:hypothetical protein
MHIDDVLKKSVFLKGRCFPDFPHLFFSGDEEEGGGKLFDHRKNHAEYLIFQQEVPGFGYEKYADNFILKREPAQHHAGKKGAFSAGKIGHKGRTFIFVRNDDRRVVAVE